MAVTRWTLQAGYQRQSARSSTGIEGAHLVMSRHLGNAAL